MSAVIPIKESRLGFTLAGLVLGISIIGVLSTIVILAINPRENILAAFDAKRQAHVNSLIKAMNDYHWETHEMLEVNTIPVGQANAKPICKSDVDSQACTASGGISLALLVPNYITTIPEDATEPCPLYSGFRVYQESGRALALAPHLGLMPGEAGLCVDEVPPPAGTPGITVNPTSGLITTEAGGSATFTMVLDAAPTQSVSITVTSTDTTENLVSDGITTAASVAFTFTTGNWNSAQTVSLIGQDDALVDGDIAFTITTEPAVSADSGYSGMDANDVSVTNTNDDTGPPTCNGLTATIYVDETNTIVGGPDDGDPYVGTLNGTSSVNVMVGTIGVDDINALGGNDTICGLDGDDDIDGGGGADSITAGDGNDSIQGGNGSDIIHAGDGNDTIAGEANADTICGESGNDSITGADGNDLIDGGPGTDTIDGGSNPDTCVNGETVTTCTTTTGSVAECN